MDFKLLGRFDEFFDDSCYRKGDNFHIRGKRKYSNRAGKYSINIRGHKDGLYVIKSSVNNSFGKLFEFTTFKDEKSVCIFIPHFDYLWSCIELRDIESLSLCKKWLDYLSLPPFGLVDLNRFYECIRNNIYPKAEHFNDEILKNIPMQTPLDKEHFGFDFHMNRWIRIRLNPRIMNSLTVCGDHELIKYLNNYNPLSLQSRIASILSLKPSIKFECITIVDYLTLIEHGVDQYSMSMSLDYSSTPLFIMTAKDNIHAVSSIVNDDIADYISKPKIKVILGSPKALRIGLFSDINYCINAYGSLQETPKHLIDEVIDKISLRSNLYACLEPLVSYMSENNIKIETDSPMFSILFPNTNFYITSNALATFHNYIVYTDKTLNYDKETFLRDVARCHNKTLLSKLYELYDSGFITTEEVTHYGLDLIYSFCGWMIEKKRSVRAMKRAY